eukprot:scaffold277236_cov23-Tisochrysis_lutea.AAC.1
MACSFTQCHRNSKHLEQQKDSIRLGSFYLQVSVNDVVLMQKRETCLNRDEIPPDPVTVFAFPATT